MTVADLRKELGLSLKAFGAVLGLKSPGHVHQIENGLTVPSRKVALEIERVSGGRIKAVELNPRATEAA